MNIAEAKNAKKLLEKEIYDAIDKFRQETGLKVVDVRVKPVSNISGYVMSYIVSATVEL
jgi:hypothetical protein